MAPNHRRRAATTAQTGLSTTWEGRIVSDYKVGYFVGSLSKQSINRHLANALVRLAPRNLSMTEIPIGDLPLYNRDLDNDYPPVAKKLK
jgi:chromate reductase